MIKCRKFSGTHDKRAMVNIKIKRPGEEVLAYECFFGHSSHSVMLQKTFFPCLRSFASKSKWPVYPPDLGVNLIVVGEVIHILRRILITCRYRSTFCKTYIIYTLIRDINVSD